VGAHHDHDSSATDYSAGGVGTTRRRRRTATIIIVIVSSIVDRQIPSSRSPAYSIFVLVVLARIRHERQ
jgi:hypothetical protein